MRIHPELPLSLLSLALVLAACQPPPQAAAPAPAAPAALGDAEIAQLKAAHDAAEALAGVDGGDWAAFVDAHYTADAVLLPPNGEPVRGRDAIVAFFSSFPPMNRFDTEYVEVAGVGDLAYNWGTYELEATPEGAEPVVDRGKYIEIFRRQPDGGWKVTRDIFNSSLPAAGAPE